MSGVHEWEYHVSISKSQDCRPLIAWCRENTVGDWDTDHLSLMPRSWHFQNGTVQISAHSTMWASSASYYFDNANDAVRFKLTWGAA